MWPVSKAEDSRTDRRFPRSSQTSDLKKKKNKRALKRLPCQTLGVISSLPDVTDLVSVYCG